MTHSTGAESRLNRIKPSVFGSEEYAREELVAELGSALVAQRYGLSKNVKDESAAYLKSWLNSLKELPDFIKTTLFDVKRASAMITQCVDVIREKMEAKADIGDVDNDGIMDEVAHEEKQLVEEVNCRRGR